MPGRGTPRQAIRMPADLWERLGEVAEAEGTDRSAVVRALVRWWLREPGAAIPARPKPGDRTPPPG